MTPRKAWVALVVWHVLLWMLCVCFTPLSTELGIGWMGYHWRDWHPFVLPHVIAVSLLLCLYVGAGMDSPLGNMAGLAAGWGQPVLIATYVWASALWPGGDDGGGMGWGLLVGPMTMVPVIVVAGIWFETGIPVSRSAWHSPVPLRLKTWQAAVCVGILAVLATGLAGGIAQAIAPDVRHAVALQQLKRLEAKYGFTTGPLPDSGSLRSCLPQGRSGRRWGITSVQPQSPLAKAGIRVGDATPWIDVDDYFLPYFFAQLDAGRVATFAIPTCDEHGERQEREVQVSP